MSYSLMQMVVDTIGIPVMPKAALFVLARHALDDGTNKKCPSVQTIADKAGMCAKAARNALRWLEDEGWILPLGKKSGGRKVTTNYLILVAKLDPKTRYDVPPNGHDTACETRHEMPPICETRYDVPLNAVPDTAEEVTKSQSKKEEGELESSPRADACVRESPPDRPPVKTSAKIIPMDRQARLLKPCDAAWTVPEDWDAWARSHGHGTCEIAERRFKVYWSARKAQCLRMSEAELRERWELWILENVERERKNASGSNGSKHDRLAHGLAGAFSDIVDAGSEDSGSLSRDVACRHR